MARFPELSCFTTNLVAYLEPAISDIRDRFALATRLAVRASFPAVELEFSHHARVDQHAGWTLGYQGAGRWAEARSALAQELSRAGQVLAVANLSRLSWAPASDQRAATAHWILLRARRDERWLVSDYFTALTPHGEQRPFTGWLDDAQLAEVLAPLPEPSALEASRDRMALGEAMPLPAQRGYRWLARTATDPSRDLDSGGWLTELPAISRVADVITADPTAASRFADDLWTASRHHVHRLTVLIAQGLADPERAAWNLRAWQELPRTLRFAAMSAERGQPRMGLLRLAFGQLMASTEPLARNTLERAEP